MQRVVVKLTYAVDGDPELKEIELNAVPLEPDDEPEAVLPETVGEDGIFSLEKDFFEGENVEQIFITRVDVLDPVTARVLKTNEFEPAVCHDNNGLMIFVALPLYDIEMLSLWV